MWSALAIAVVFAAGLAAYAAFALPLWAEGVPAWLLTLGLPVAFFVILAIFVAWYFALAWVHRAPRPPYARIGLRATLRLVALEYWTLAGAPLRMLLYRILVRDPPPAPAALPVLLLHGVLCNGGVWASTLRHLRNAGVGPVYALSYGPPLASIERFAEQVQQRIDEIRAATGAARLVIVTHSMGGLVALAYLRRYGAGRVARLVAIGAPFHGSVHARWFFGTSLSQLRPGNAWLAALHARAPAGGPPVASIWSWHDSMVTPQTSSLLDGAHNIALTGIGHNALLRNPAVLELVVAEYRAAALDVPAATSECPA